MKKLIIPALLIGYLVFTNPTEADFRQFAEQKIEARVREEIQKRQPNGGGLMDRIQDLAGDFLSRLASQSVERTNYGIFSTYLLDLPETVSQKDWKFIGIAGQFFPLERPEFIEEHP